MIVRPRQLLGCLIVACLSASFIPAAFAEDLVQEDTKIAFPATITVERDGLTHTLAATGVGLREATVLKVNVYAIVSYVEEGTHLGTDPARGMIAADVAKRIEMKFVRDVEADKVTEAYRDGVKKNMKDRSLFEKDLEIFLNVFTDDLKVGDTIVLTYIPRAGVITTLNGVEKSVIENPALGLALWSIWFGEKPVSGGMRKDLLSLVTD